MEPQVSSLKMSYISHNYKMTIMTPPTKSSFEDKIRTEPSIQLIKSDLELRIFHINFN